MYCLVPEKPLRLVYGTFYLAISVTFYERINFNIIKALYANTMRKQRVYKYILEIQIVDQNNL